MQIQILQNYSEANDDEPLSDLICDREEKGMQFDIGYRKEIYVKYLSGMMIIFRSRYIDSLSLLSSGDMVFRLFSSNQSDQSGFEMNYHFKYQPVLPKGFDYPNFFNKMLF